MRRFGEMFQPCPAHAISVPQWDTAHFTAFASALPPDRVISAILYAPSRLKGRRRAL